MDPYEKLLSPNRVVRRSQYSRGKDEGTSGKSEEEGVTIEKDENGDEGTTAVL